MTGDPLPAPAGASCLPRTLAVWCPDWPVTAAAAAAGVCEQRPAVVLAANRVVATNHAARQCGVRRGQRKREAEYRCPDLALLTGDPAAAARLFEPVVAALETVVAGVEITRPGLVSIAVRGPARYYGGEHAALATVAAALPADICTGAMLGIADGAFAAAVAARAGAIVPVGGSSGFLAPLPISTLGTARESPLVDVLIRLGIKTLGAFAALPAHDVATRFGPSGAWAHRLAGGCDDRPILARRPPADCAVRVEFPEPLDRADTVAFSVRASAQELLGRLADHDAACGCVEVGLDLETGRQVTRRWRHTELLTAAGIVDRIRWQLDGLFAAGGAGRESGGVTAMTLTAVETVPVGTHQLALWGGAGERDERAELGIARIQSRYGQHTVVRLVVQGGSGPAARGGRVPWGEAADPRTPPGQPWPGHLPAPAPTIVLDRPRPVRVLDAAGRPVAFTDRAAISAPPATLGLDGRRLLPITTWAGPWPDAEQWWDPDTATPARRLRCQLGDAGGRAYLVTSLAGRADPPWLLEGIYD